jgi:hypothetical protein
MYCHFGNIVFFLVMGCGSQHHPLRPALISNPLRVTSIRDAVMCHVGQMDKMGRWEPSHSEDHRPSTNLRQIPECFFHLMICSSLCYDLVQALPPVLDVQYPHTLNAVPYSTNKIGRSSTWWFYIDKIDVADLVLQPLHLINWYRHKYTSQSVCTSE